MAIEGVKDLPFVVVSALHNGQDTICTTFTYIRNMHIVVWCAACPNGLQSLYNSELAAEQAESIAAIYFVQQQYSDVRDIWQSREWASTAVAAKKVPNHRHWNLSGPCICEYYGPTVTWHK